MTPIRLLTAAAISALIAAPAFAQDMSNPPVAPATPPPADGTMPMGDDASNLPPTADEAATPASATTADPTIVRQSSPTPVDQAYTLKAGDPSVTSNGPVPDTVVNRAKYGSPISNGGKRTTPKGN